MKNLMKRPLAFSCGVFVLSLFLQISFNLNTAVRAALAAAGVLFLLSFLIIFIIEKMSGKKTGGKKYALLLVCVPLLISLLLSQISFYSKYESGKEYLGETHSYTARVDGAVYSSSYSAEYGVTVTQADGKDIKPFGALLTDTGPGAEEGDIISFDALLSEPEPEERSYNVSNGRIFVLKEPGEITLISTDNPLSLSGKAAKMNAALDRVIEKYTDGDGHALSSAMFLGNRSAISQDVKRDFRELGIYHLLALSGLHLALLTGILGVILTPLLGKRKTNIFRIIFTVFYILLCGMTPSITRAGIMFILLLLSFFLRRNSDSITTLFFSVALICLFDPFSATDAGLLLSFAATLGIIICSGGAENLAGRICPAAGKVKKRINSILNGFFISFGAILFTLPLIFVYYGEFPLFSALFTFIASPFVTVILLLSVLLLVFSFIPLFAAGIGAALSFVCRILLFITGKTARLCDLTVSLDYNFTGIIIAAVIAVIILLALLNKATFKRIIILLSAGALVFGACYTVHWIRMPEISYSIYNEKENDALLIVSGRRATVIDSSAEYYSFLNKALSGINKEYKLDETENLVITHYHKSLPNTLLRLSEKYYIKNILLPKPLTESEREIYDSVAAKKETIQAEIKEYGRGESITVSGLEISAGKPFYLSRSGHGIYSVKISKPGYYKDIIYLSSPYPEAADPYDIIEKEKKADIIIGTHGPKYKENAGNIFESADIENLLFASDADSEFYK